MHDGIQTHGLHHPADAAPVAAQSAANSMGHLRRNKASQAEHKYARSGAACDRYDAQIRILVSKGGIRWTTEKNCLKKC